ncbi:hypothetical protein ACV07N_06475 [Roseivirga echinicomitans]
MLNSWFLTFKLSALCFLLFGLGVSLNQGPNLDDYLKTIGANESLKAGHILILDYGKEAYVDDQWIERFINTKYNFKNMTFIIVCDGTKVINGFIKNKSNTIILDSTMAFRSHPIYSGRTLLFKKTDKNHERIEILMENAYQERLSLFRSIKKTPVRAND